MKSLRSQWGVIFVMMGLILCSGTAWGAEWKELAEATTGIFQYDAASIRTSPEGFIRVWIYNAIKRETHLVELNCRGRGYRVLDVTEYDPSGRISGRQDYYDNPTWLNIPPRSVVESLQKIVCR